MTIADVLLVDFDPEMSSTRKVLERIPEDNPTWTPDPKSMPIGRLARLVARMPEWATDYLTTSERDYANGWGDFNFTNREDLLAGFDKAVATLRPQLAAAADTDLLATWTMRMGDTVLGSGSRLFFYRFWFLNHLIHHRTQLASYLRLLQVPVPALYGPSADEKIGF